jgi:acyl-CoA synthetase (AMP-forming)/AMP-acid ligase II
VPDLFDEVVSRSGGHEAFVDGRRRLTFAQWARAADGVASWLHARGVGRGDVVALRLPSSIEFAVAYQGAMRVGAVTTGINPRLGPTEVRSILERSGAVVVLDDPAEVAAASAGPPFRARPRLSATDPVAIVWTSGTTGRPKGALFDHACLQAVAEGAGVLSRPGDRRLSATPFSHVGSMTRVWDELAHLVTTIITPVPWRAGEALALIGREGVTVAQGVPTQWQLMVDHPDLATTDVSSLRIAATGAARVPPELVARVREAFGCPFVVRYTSTETSLGTGTGIDDPLEVVATTVGRPQPGVELRVDDADHPGAPGRISLRSRAAMRSYWADPEGTAAAVSPDGWVRTGDEGFVDGDGNLHLVGRRSEMYIRGGYNVHPTEVENVLGGHPAVAGVAVVGSGPVPVLGEIGVAFVVARPGARPRLDELRSFVAGSLADYKAPDLMVTVDDLPVTSLGKIDKRALRARADEEARQWRR